MVVTGMAKNYSEFPYEDSFVLFKHKASIEQNEPTIT